MNDQDGAIAAFRDAVRIDPNQGRAQIELISTLTRAARHAEALQAYLDVWKVNPTSAENPQNGLRYEAARSAVRCSQGGGINAPPPAERPAYRKQSLDLLTADFAAVQSISARDRDFAHRTMERWLVEKELGIVRTPKAL